jgi:hypothetical protein
MSKRPDPPPWGALITAALSRGRISAREAARQAGISEGRWRQISGGYQVVSAGVYAPVRGPAPTLARMAAVAGVTPQELRTAGRADAAHLLEAQAAASSDAAGDSVASHGAARRLGAAGLPATGNSADDQLLARIRSMSSDQARELLAQIAIQLGIAGADDGADDGAGDRERRYGT